MVLPYGECRWLICQKKRFWYYLQAINPSNLRAFTEYVENRLFITSEERIDISSSILLTAPQRYTFSPEIDCVLASKFLERVIVM